MKKTLPLILVLACACSVSAATGAPSSARVGPADWSGTLANGDTVYVRNVNGRIRVVPSGSAAVEVRAEASGGAKLEVVPHAGGVTVCGIPKAKSHTCEAKHLSVDGSEGESKINLEVAVPASAILDVSTVNGGVTVEAVGARTRAVTVNGGLQIEAVGPLEAKTVNGGVDVQIAARASAGDVELETVNGSIHLSLPASFDADVNAHTVHGAIRSKRPLAIAESPGSRKASGRLGKGGRQIRMNAVNGSIALD